MEYLTKLQEYAPAPTVEEVAEKVAAARVAAKANETTDVYKFCYSIIDLTTLACTDSVESVTRFARRAAEFYIDYPHIPNVASICVYPPFVETVGLAVDGTPMRITSVSGGFPASQTFLEVKVLETAMAIENGADEIDMVINLGDLKDGRDAELLAEIKAIKAALPSDIELEAFIHGSMCVSYSGRCMLSNELTGRDGNRGACAQPCRLPFKSRGKKGESYPLSLKDLSLASHIKELCDMGVNSFKIERADFKIAACSSGLYSPLSYK